MYQVSCFYHKVHDSTQNCYISAPLSVTVDLLFIVGPIVAGMLCLVLVLFSFSIMWPSSFALILMGKRKLIDLLCCLPYILWWLLLCGSSSG